jgi:hypothetical protein
MNKTRQRSSQQMQALIEKFNKSNVSKKQFCRQEGIPLSVFYYWQKKFKQTGQPSGEGFLPVEVNHKTSIQSSIEISFPNGVVMRLEAGCDIEMIRSLITSI